MKNRPRVWASREAVDFVRVLVVSNPFFFAIVARIPPRCVAHEPQAVDLGILIRMCPAPSEAIAVYEYLDGFLDSVLPACHTRRSHAKARSAKANGTTKDTKDTSKSYQSLSDFVFLVFFVVLSTPMASGNDVVKDFSMHVGEPEVAAGVAVGEALVVEAEQVQDRGVQVVHARGVLDGFEAELVGGAIDGAAADSAAGHPHGEAVRVVIAAELGLAVAAELDGRRAAEFAAPDHERVVEHSALLQVGQQRGDRLIDLLGQLR